MSDSLLNMKIVLEKAASSPDPAVRTAAIHYYKLQQQLHALDGFFSFYGQAQSDASLQEPIKAKPAIKTTSAAPRGGMDAFIKRVCDLLLRNGQPIGISRLYDTFYQAHPDDDKVSLDTFRQRLFKKRHQVPLLSDGRGYWPAGVSVPQEGSLAA